MTFKSIARAVGLSLGITAQVVAAGLLMFGCQASEVGDSEPAQHQDGISLSVAESGHVVGSFVLDGVGVDFDSVRDAAGVRLSLRSSDGRLLLELHDDLQAKQQTIRFGNRLSQTISHRLLSAPTLEAAPDASEFQTTGELSAAQDFGDTAEYRLLPALSRALGELGFDGRSYPAALPLHLLALRANEEIERGLPSPESMQTPDGAGEGGPSAPGVQPQGLQPGPCVPIKCTDGRSACLGTAGCLPPAPAPVAPRCPTNNGQSLQGDPCGNRCYGMCGSDCSCWTWVCGDCNYHSGCAAHDDWCRSCSVWAPWNCGLCYSPTALVGLDCRL